MDVPLFAKLKQVGLVQLLVLLFVHQFVEMVYESGLKTAMMELQEMDEDVEQTA